MVGISVCTKFTAAVANQVNGKGRASEARQAGHVLIIVMGCREWPSLTFYSNCDYLEPKLMFPLLDFLVSCENKFKLSSAPTVAVSCVLLVSWPSVLCPWLCKTLKI